MTSRSPFVAADLNFSCRFPAANPFHPRNKFFGDDQFFDRIVRSFQFLFTKRRMDLFVARLANQLHHAPLAALGNQVMSSQLFAWILVQTDRARLRLLVLVDHLRFGRLSFVMWLLYIVIKTKGQRKRSNFPRNSPCCLSYASGVTRILCQPRLFLLAQVRP